MPEHTNDKTATKAEPVAYACPDCRGQWRVITPHPCPVAETWVDADRPVYQ